MSTVRALVEAAKPNRALRTSMAHLRTAWWLMRTHTSKQTACPPSDSHFLAVKLGITPKYALFTEGNTARAGQITGNSRTLGDGSV
jgi:hypothetical protein